MLRLIACAVTALMLSVTANAAPIVFDSDPFAGSSAVTTPGRQIVGGEDAIVFDIAHDVFTFASASLALRRVFAVGKKGIELSDASRP